MTFRGGVQEGDPKQPICSDEGKGKWRKQQPRCQRDDNIYNCSARGEGCGSCSVKVNTEVALCVACEALSQRKWDSSVAEIAVTVGGCPVLTYWQVFWEDAEALLPIFQSRECVTWVITIRSRQTVRPSLLLKQLMYVKSTEWLWLLLHGYVN